MVTDSLNELTQAKPTLQERIEALNSVAKQPTQRVMENFVESLSIITELCERLAVAKTHLATLYSVSGGANRHLNIALNATDLTKDFQP